MRDDRRRDRRRGRAQESGEFSVKNALYIAGTILALGLIAFVITVMVYNNSLEKIYDDLETKEIADLGDTNKEQTEEVSTNLRKNY